MGNDKDSSDLKIQIYDKEQQENQEDFENNLLKREKLEEEFYDIYKKEQQEYENHLREEQKKHETEEENKANTKKQMDKIIFLMENGKSRQDAAEEVGVNINIVDDWYNNGLNWKNGDYLDFYLKVYNIERKNKASNSTNNKIKCKNCGKYLDSDSKFCFYCGVPINSTKNPDVNFCENCGTKLDENHLNYCINCGHPISSIQNNVKSNNSTKQGNSTKKGSSSVTSSNNNQDNFDFKLCCVGIIIVFLAFAFIFAII